MKLAWMKFYPGDWLKDPALRSCSEGARSLWIDLLCLMWECPRRGYLKTGKQSWGLLEIAHALGANVGGLQSKIEELLVTGVLRRSRAGTLYSKRIARDEIRRKYFKIKQKGHRDKSAHVKRMSKGEVRSHMSEIRSKSSSSEDLPEEDSIALFPELQAQYPISGEHFAFAVRQVRTRSNGPPRSLAYWRKALTRFFENWDEEVKAYEREQADAAEARAGHNPYGRAN